LDPDECNIDGLTPEDLFEDRENTSPELQDAFWVLLEVSLQNDGTLELSNIESSSGYSDSDGDGEFTDAVEFKNGEN
jgi:hypothetical protein